MDLDLSKVPAKKAVRRSRPRRHARSKRKPCKPYVPTPAEPSLFHRSTFSILPRHVFPDSIYWISLSCIPNTVSAIAKELFAAYKPFFPAAATPIHATGEHNPFTESFFKIRKSFVFRTQRIRWVFRRFLHRWRASRLQQPILEDIVTGSIPVRPVYIVDWPGRTAVPFEAATLHRDITERLQTHDGFFEDPQPPRNPLTNLPLTQAQQISVWNSISQAGIPVSASFTEFRRVRWSLERFLLEYSTPLQLHAFKTTMRDMTHNDTHDRILDFIEYAYDQESIDCSTATYKWSLLHHPTHRILLKWRDLCEEFYEASILWCRTPNKCSQVQGTVLDRTVELLDQQRELILLRNAHLRLQRQQHSRAQAPPPAPLTRTLVIGESTYLTASVNLLNL
jgi:hypothetical protein